MKIAQIEYSPKNVTLKNFLVIPTPQGVFSGSDLENVELIAYALQQAVDVKKIRGLILGVGGAGTVHFRKLQIPKVDKKILRQTVRFEMEQYLGQDPTNFVVGYHSVESPMGDGLDVYVTVITRSVIQKLMALENYLKTKIFVIDYLGFGVFNSWWRSQVAPPMGSFLLLHVGAINTYVIIVFQGKLDFVREISFGGFNCSNEIRTELGITFEEAEMLKMSLSEETHVPEMLPKIVDAHLDMLMGEIQNSIDYYNSISGGEFKPQSVVLSGGGSLLKGLPEKVAQAFNVPVDYWSAQTLFQKVENSLNDMWSSIGVLGACVCGIGLQKA